MTNRGLWKPPSTLQLIIFYRQRKDHLPAWYPFGAAASSLRLLPPQRRLDAFPDRRYSKLGKRAHKLRRIDFERHLKLIHHFDDLPHLPVEHPGEAHHWSRDDDRLRRCARNREGLFDELSAGHRRRSRQMPHVPVRQPRFGQQRKRSTDITDVIERVRLIERADPASPLSCDHCRDDEHRRGCILGRTEEVGCPADENLDSTGCVRFKQTVGESRSDGSFSGVI